MRGRAARILAVCALACAGAACSGGGSGGSNGGDSSSGGSTVTSAFPQGFLPVRRDAVTPGRGDVAFRPGGDLYVVDGSSDVTAVSRANGAVTTFANDVDHGNGV